MTKKAQIDLRQLRPFLEKWLSASVNQFLIEHPDAVVSAMGMHFTFAGNNPWILLGFDTNEHSDLHLERHPKWPGVDEYGKFCDNPSDFKYGGRDFHFAELGGPPYWYEVEHVQITMMNEETKQFNLRDFESENYDSEADSSEKQIKELLFNFIVSVVESSTEYKRLRRDNTFRIIMTSYNSFHKEAWVVN